MSNRIKNNQIKNNRLNKNNILAVKQILNIMYTSRIKSLVIYNLILSEMTKCVSARIFNLYVGDCTLLCQNVCISRAYKATNKDIGQYKHGINVLTTSEHWCCTKSAKFWVYCLFRLAYRSSIVWAVKVTCLMYDDRLLLGPGWQKASIWLLEAKSNTHKCLRFSQYGLDTSKYAIIGISLPQLASKAVIASAKVCCSLLVAGVETFSPSRYEMVGAEDSQN